MTSVRTYLVTVQTPKGEAVLEVPTTLGPEAAARRAFWTAAAMGWGDLDEISVIGTQEEGQSGAA